MEGRSNERAMPARYAGCPMTQGRDSRVTECRRDDIRLAVNEQRATVPDSDSGHAFEPEITTSHQRQSSAKQVSTSQSFFTSIQLVEKLFLPTLDDFLRIAAMEVSAPRISALMWDVLQFYLAGST